MPVNDDQKPYLLPALANQKLFETSILPSALAVSLPSEHPEAIFLGGQSGSGKSSLANFLRVVRQEPFILRWYVVVNSDALREYHPAFEYLQKIDPLRASYLVNPDTVIWQQKLIEATIAARRDVLLDGTLGGHAELIVQTMRRFKEKGYLLKACVLSVPARLSRFGIYKRYEDQITKHGFGRWVGLAAHDRQYDDIPNTLTRLETEKIVDQIQLYERPTHSGIPKLLYNNQLVDDLWVRPPQVAQVLAETRNRNWTRKEQQAFSLAVQLVYRSMRQRGTSVGEQLTFYKHVGEAFTTHRPATPADVRLYFDWANDPATRQYSFNTKPIPFEVHEAWFARKLTDPNALLLVFETPDNVPVGQVRFEQQTEGEVVIGLSVDAAFRGMGLASVLIEEACALYWQQRGNVLVTAYIKPDNQASIRAFQRAGFAIIAEEVDKICLVK
jgi:RimJ/RimL family protein N-acetyltransferase/energy-coupling factor transporter ATP-binding protein EcfA2